MAFADLAVEKAPHQGGFGLLVVHSAKHFTYIISFHSEEPDE